jgi:ribonuclease HI
MTEVIIYTDGACSGNPGPGGWGSVLESEGRVKEISGGESLTTNNRMELTAVIEALKQLKLKCKLIIYTDSEYVKNGITSWIKKWAVNGWKTADKKEVKNKDLWIQLNNLTQGHTIDWRWVKGHSGVPGNERCDLLARQEIERIKRIKI